MAICENLCGTIHSYRRYFSEMNAEVPSSVAVKAEEPEPESEVQQADVNDSPYEFLGFLEEEVRTAEVITLTRNFTKNIPKQAVSVIWEKLFCVKTC